MSDTSSTLDQATNRPASKTDLFLSFTWLALQGFGGVLAVVQRELVDKKRWMTREQFVEDWAVAQIMPGPNVVNLSIMIGDRYFGLRGAFAALAGMLTSGVLVPSGSPSASRVRGAPGTPGGPGDLASGSVGHGQPGAPVTVEALLALQRQLVEQGVCGAPVGPLSVGAPQPARPQSLLPPETAQPAPGMGRWSGALNQSCVRRQSSVRRQSVVQSPPPPGPSVQTLERGASGRRPT
jgi:hypothetical protein